MSLSLNIQNLAIRVGNEVKALRTLINGNAKDLSALTTTDKTSLLGAVNELNAAIANTAAKSGAVINDTGSASSTTYSSQKIDAQIQAAINGLIAGAPGALDTLKEIADQLANDESTVSALTTSIGDKASKADVGDTSTDYVVAFEGALS